MVTAPKVERAVAVESIPSQPGNQRPKSRAVSFAQGGQPSASAQPIPASPRRFEEFEAYRGIAALLIVIFHAYQFSRQATRQTTYVYEDHAVLHHLFSNLDAGVAWFFALSGFLLFLPIARAALGSGLAQPARAFLIKRAIRILPLYYLAIT